MTTGAAAYQTAKTHCPKNHEYTEENTSYTLSGRRCRTCVRGYKQNSPGRYTAPQNTQWRDKAACREMPPEMFQPTNEVDARKAQRVCVKSCPVFAECAIEAKAQGPHIAGVWAGEWFPETSAGRKK